MASPMVDFTAEYGSPLRVAPDRVCALEVLVCSNHSQVLLVTDGSKYVVGTAADQVGAEALRDAVELQLYGP